MVSTPSQAVHTFPLLLFLCSGRIGCFSSCDGPFSAAWCICIGAVTAHSGCLPIVTTKHVFQLPAPVHMLERFPSISLFFTFTLYFIFSSKLHYLKLQFQLIKLLLFEIMYSPTWYFKLLKIMHVEKKLQIFLHTIIFTIN